jgi:hypothetical protein
MFGVIAPPLNASVRQQPVHNSTSSHAGTLRKWLVRGLLLVLFTVTAAAVSVGAVGVSCGVGNYVTGDIPTFCGHNAGTSIILAFAVLWPLTLLVGPLLYWKLLEKRGLK